MCLVLIIFLLKKSAAAETGSSQRVNFKRGYKQDAPLPAFYTLFSEKNRFGYPALFCGADSAAFLAE
jgi:hypothetical protein